MVQGKVHEILHIAVNDAERQGAQAAVLGGDGVAMPLQPDPAAQSRAMLLPGMQCRAGPMDTGFVRTKYENGAVSLQAGPR